MRKKKIDIPQIRAAMAELRAWSHARADLTARLAQEEEFYRLRIAPRAHCNTEGEDFAPRSAWLLNTILQKHADMMESIPSAICLAREQGDEADAAALSRILPVILERSHFEEHYSDNMWYKLKHGVCAWGVFWNTELENGLGDVDVRRVELQNLYWQPDVRDLEDSRALYMVERMDRETLCARYPQCSAMRTESEPLHGEEQETDRVTVVDWYYKKRMPGGRTVLHYCKFTGDTVLFASENDPRYRDGWYAHGTYPFVLDVLYPIEGTCTGFGIVAMARDPQIYIDRMDRNLLEYMDWATRVRYFCKKNVGINTEEFGDLTRRIVEVEGDIDEERLRPITAPTLDHVWLSLKTLKVDELKETTANRDVLQGLTSGGVTAAAAIAALQEAGSKVMRDMVGASYRAFVRVVRLVIECVRQFYSEARSFRILGADGTYRFVSWSNEGIRERVGEILPDGTALCRRPIFDIDVRAEKKNATSRLSHNETMLELYRLGVFDPANAAAAKILLDGMDFEGIGRVREQVAALAASAQTSAPRTIEEERASAPLYDQEALLAKNAADLERLRAEATAEQGL